MDYQNSAIANAELCCRLYGRYDLDSYEYTGEDRKCTPGIHHSKRPRVKGIIAMILFDLFAVGGLLLFVRRRKASALS